MPRSMQVRGVRTTKLAGSTANQDVATAVGKIDGRSQSIDVLVEGQRAEFSSFGKIARRLDAVHRIQIEVNQEHPCSLILKKSPSSYPTVTVQTIRIVATGIQEVPALPGSADP
jgi:hypothetical protein